jgi:hypothetical protein
MTKRSHQVNYSDGKQAIEEYGWKMHAMREKVDLFEKKN